MALDFQAISAIVFLILLSLILYLERKKLAIQGKFPFFYVLMYRTKFGLKFMDTLAKKFTKTLKILGYIGIVVGFLGMILLSFLLIQNVFDIFTKPDVPAAAGLVLPFEVKGAVFVPFFYWIISIFILALVHEYAHGVIARVHNLKVKSSGFGFVGLLIPILPLAFVEPDEKALRKSSHLQQLSVFAAGPFSNIILAFILLLLLNFALFPAFVALNEINGVKITALQEVSAAREAGIEVGETILEVDGHKIKSFANISNSLKSFDPGDTVNIKTDEGLYSIELIENPGNASLPYIGINLQYSSRLKEQYQSYAILNSIFLWFVGNPFENPQFLGSGLIGWLVILNLGIGLFNLVPLGPIDGGRMMQIALYRVFKDKKRADKIWHKISIIFLFIVLIIIIRAFIA